MVCRLWASSPRKCSSLYKMVATPRPRLAWIGALLRDRRGMSAVEFGLAAPVFLAMLTPVIYLGLAFSQQIRINQAVEAGAQYAAMNQYNTNSSTSCDSTKPWAACVSGAMTNATAIGFLTIVNASNKAVIGNNSVTVIGGHVGWSILSDGRFKKNIKEKHHSYTNMEQNHEKSQHL